MRNWIGAHQLQEMINVNADISVEEPENIEENVVDIAEDGTNILALPGSAYIKPVGVDQAMAVFDDLKHGMEETCITIRDPGIDFQESDDIPDLISIIFVNDLGGAFDAESDRGTLQVTAQYGTGNNPNFLNEIWALSLLVQMYRKHLKYTGSRFNIVCHRWEESDFELKEMDWLSYGELGICGENLHEFWDDLKMLQDFATHIQFFLNEKTFENPDVSNEWCVAKLKEVFIDKIASPFLKDMAYSLTIWAFWTYGNKMPTYAGPYEDRVSDLFNMMHDTSIRVETAEFLSHESLPFELADSVREVLDNYERKRT
jgi:hypothetical protein